MTIKMDGSNSGELSVLRQIRSRAATSSATGLRLGIGDDCAILGLRSGEEAAITTDLSIAGRHFRLDWHQPEAVGHRALARGLSDLAAMGARPVAAFLSLGLPRELTKTKRAQPAWVERFFDGLLALANLHKVPLAGGDLAESPIALADIVLVGAVPRGKALFRSGAKNGDVVYVTGSLGGAAAGLQELAAFHRSSSKPRRIPKQLAESLAPHLYPQPRIQQGLALRRRNLASAAIDLSDGISTDLAHLCEESSVAAEIDADLLPIHAAATLNQALNGGEDYELLFTARPATRIPATLAGVPVTRIGLIRPLRRGVPAVTLKMQKGSQPLEPRGWEHFS